MFVFVILGHEDLNELWLQARMDTCFSRLRSYAEFYHGWRVHWCLCLQGFLPDQQHRIEEQISFVSRIQSSTNGITEESNRNVRLIDYEEAHS